ncbi:MAG: hypothetical protein JW904_10470 [Spirochaetales bacterium]|nr:hypothetical protein [Spirochaetales bacterium]
MPIRHSANVIAAARINTIKNKKITRLIPVRLPGAQDDCFSAWIFLAYSEDISLIG